jgi:HAD superfamily hydrolase (TIGR01549 family)
MNENVAKLKWIFFDLGSTLTDESVFEKYMFDTVWKTLKESGAHVDRQAFNKTLKAVVETRKSGSGGYRGIIRELALRFTKNRNQLQTVIDDYSNHVSNKYLEMQILYPEARGVLNKLSNRYALGIIANQPREARPRLADLGLVEYLKVIALSDEVGYSKPNRQIFLQALAEAECEPQRAMMVGDRLDNDVGPAKSVGMMTVRVRRGLMVYQTPITQTEIPDYQILTLKDLLSII